MGWVEVDGQMIDPHRLLESAEYGGVGAGLPERIS
jgi:hypothetical protein